MAKYVDADKLRLEIKNMGLFETAKFIKTFPSEDVSPVIHAHWILDGKDPYDERANLFACSMCGLGRSFHTNPPAYNYCPWCGAKMDEEGNDE